MPQIPKDTPVAVAAVIGIAMAKDSVLAIVAIGVITILFGIWEYRIERRKTKDE